MFQAERLHIILIEVKNDRLFFGHDGRGVGFVVEDGQFGDCRAGAFDVNHLLTTVDAFAERSAQEQVPGKIRQRISCAHL